MPPRAAKKIPAGPMAAAKMKPKVSAKPAEPAEAAAAAADAAAEVTPELVVLEVKEETKTAADDVNGSVDAEAKDVNESFKDDKEDHVELEEHELEEEPEEETAVDYDGQEDDSEGEEVGEDGEDGDAREEEEAEMLDEDLEDGGEGEEDAEGEVEQEVDPEEEEHHEVVKEHRKRKEFEIFIGGLDKDVTDDDLKKVFSEVGDVTEVRLMMNPSTKKNRGFAFLRFATVEQAKRAVSEMKNPVVNGKKCGVTPSQDSDTLFVGNICKTWTKEYFKEKLKTYGIENIEDMALVEDSTNKGMNRGFAFLEFSSRSEAMNAYKLLRKRDVFLGTDRIAKVSFADSFIEPDDEVMAQVKTVFVDGLPSSWDEDRVIECLKKYGVIEKVDLARNMPSAKRKDFGFVTFEMHDNAVACAEGINSEELGEGANKVKVRARLARPRQRGGSFGMGRGARRGGRGPPREGRGRFGIGRGVRGSGRMPYGRPLSSSRSLSRVPRATRDFETPTRSHGFRRATGIRGRHPLAVRDNRSRQNPPPERPFSRRLPPIPAYPKKSLRRFGAPRSRPTTDYVSSIPVERHPSYKEDYSSRRSGYSDIAPRSDLHTASRRAYTDDGYHQSHERPPPSYQASSREYPPVSRPKRPYSDLDDAPRYSSVHVRQNRARFDYEVEGGTSQVANADRLERYGGRRPLFDQDGLYRSRHATDYSEGSLPGNVGSGLYSTSLGSRYASDGSNGGGSSYSSLYSGRNLGSSSYLGGGSGGGGGSSYY